MPSQVPAIADVQDAQRRIAGHAFVTPLLRAPALDAACGGTVLIKADSLQRTGSFKFRGAFNRLSRMNAQERAAGVVAFSSGNHAQAVAAAARIFAVKATIVMPADTPAIKIANTKAYGAAVVTYDRAREDREAIARRICGASGAVLVPPFDDPDVIAGQGTCGLELMTQARDMGLTVDDVLCPASGGGLIAGVAIGVHHLNPAARVYAVEPVAYDDHRRSLASGKRERNSSTATALCDSLLSATPGELTWSLNSKALAGAYAVEDDEVRRALGYAFRVLKLVAEPGGAVALAALLAGRHPAEGRTVALVLSGANVDPDVYAACLKL